jgi:hypothetical protein
MIQKRIIFPNILSKGRDEDPMSRKRCETWGTHLFSSLGHENKIPTSRELREKWGTQHLFD